MGAMGGLGGMQWNLPWPMSDSNDPAAGLLDIDPSDPEVADLREEFRPTIRARFESWVDTLLETDNDLRGSSKSANTTAASTSTPTPVPANRTGATVLAHIYKLALETMPFLRGTDVLEELMGRMADRPSKYYVCDVLDALSTFVKAERKRQQARAQKEDKERKRKRGKGDAPGQGYGQTQGRSQPRGQRQEHHALAQAYGHGNAQAGTSVNAFAALAALQAQEQAEEDDDLEGMPALEPVPAAEQEQQRVWVVPAMANAPMPSLDTGGLNDVD
jgi:hypothetical protein